MSNYVDHHQWLVSNNMLTDHIKDNIAMCAYCLVEGVKEANTSIDFNSKSVVYRLLLPGKLYDNIKLLERFNNEEPVGFFESFRLKKFLKNKRGTDDSGLGYNLEEIGNKFIRGYLTKDWSVKVKLFKEDSDEAKDFWLHSEGDQSLNQ